MCTEVYCPHFSLKTVICSVSRSFFLSNSLPAIYLHTELFDTPDEKILRHIWPPDPDEWHVWISDISSRFLTSTPKNVRRIRSGHCLGLPLSTHCCSTQQDILSVSDAFSLTENTLLVSSRGGAWVERVGSGHLPIEVPESWCLSI